MENPMIEDQARDDAAEDKRRREAPEVEPEPLELPTWLYCKLNAVLEDAGYYNSEDEDDDNNTYTWCYEPRTGRNLPKLRLVVDSNETV